MKKKMIILGIILLSIILSIQTSAYAEENSTKEVVQSEQVESGGEVIEIQGDNAKKQQRSVKASDTKTFEIKRYFAQIKDGSAGQELIPMPNVDFKISYLYNGKEVFITEKGRTNEKGEILDIPAVEMPTEVTAIRVWYYLGNEDRGFIRRYNKEKYCFIITQDIPKESSAIKYWSNFWMGMTGPDNCFYYFQVARQNYHFDRAVKEYTEVVKKANELFPNSVPFEIAPINVNFERGQFVDRGNAFWRNGYHQDKIPDITIGDWSNRKFPESSVKHNIMHEWTHWNSYRETQLPLGKPETAPLVIRNSYREGWAYFVGYMFAKDYDLSTEDFLVQNDNKDGINRYFGKPTIITAKQVLYDLLDVSSADEDFSLSQRFIDDDLPELEQRRINLGLMHTIMVESKATTLQEYLNYMENKYILTASDMKKYEKVLEINGLNRDGSFRFNEDGSPVTKSAPASQEKDSLDESNEQCVEMNP
ncbi:hypothetical protein P7E02_18980 [Enterococcus hulanensis]|uniref:hypothetical protein n=1 Tax=Enterococcus hulanensis TaxID=2559929 RepID=UPI002891025E|nr:hypothetical protein [Enterococcus hulanensis]MDT2661972.1 hypothetical protein [Enterococcus hulanensis]